MLIQNKSVVRGRDVRLRDLKYILCFSFIAVKCKELSKALMHTTGTVREQGIVGPEIKIRNAS